MGTKKKEEEDEQFDQEQNIVPHTLLPENRFFYVPTSTATNLIMETLALGENVGDLPHRQDLVNKNTKIVVLANGKQRQVRQENPKSEISITIDDISKFKGNNKSVKKLFVFTLMKMNEQAVSSGRLTKDFITFSLRELVDVGIYKSSRGARMGFHEAMDVLTSIKIEGNIYLTKRETISISIPAVLFEGAKTERGQCVIFLNSGIDWSFVIKYFTILPLYYFSLSNRASDLLYYIFYLARQNTDKLKNQGYFTIKLQSIQNRLCLPSKNKNENPKRTIRQPIETAMEEIMLLQHDIYDNSDLTVIPLYHANASVAELLADGRLKIILSGAFAEPFVEIGRKTEKHIAASKERQARITEKAIAIKMAKGLEQAAKETG